MSAAVARGVHRLHDDAPWVFDDPFALPLVGPGWVEYAESGNRLASPPCRARAGVLVRSRYPEDQLVGGSYGQYVILGAGLDSFAWRRPDLLRRLRVFEIDHPATQAWKQARIAALALPGSERHVFLPVDFATQELGERLTAARFDWTRPAFFSWVGTTMYLEQEAIAATLGLVARCAPGSAMVLSYNPRPELLDDDSRAFLAAVTRLVSGMGEPLRSFFAPEEITDLVARSGLRVRDHPTTADLTARYCAQRSDGLAPLGVERLMCVST
jgi:methyltransferase (TIGR00027 family)